MINLRTLLLVLTVLSIPFFSSTNSNSQELVTNGGFESGNLAGWTQENMTGAGEWFAYTGNMFGLPAPPEGDYAASSNQSDPDSMILYQDIDLPEASTINCSAIVYYDNSGGQGPPPTPAPGPTGAGFTKNNPAEVASRVFINGDGLNIGPDDENQQYRIDIMDPSAPAFDTGAGVLLNVFQTEPGDPDILGYTPINFDLTPYAGSTVRIRAAIAVTINTLEGSIDAVSCVAENVAEVPTLSQWGLIAMAGILGIVGLMVARRRKITA